MSLFVTVSMADWPVMTVTGSPGYDIICVCLEGGNKLGFRLAPLFRYRHRGGANSSNHRQTGLFMQHVTDTGLFSQHYTDD
jgi:hypothetical protein